MKSRAYLIYLQRKSKKVFIYNTVNGEKISGLNFKDVLPFKDEEINIHLRSALKNVLV